MFHRVVVPSLIIGLTLLLTHFFGLGKPFIYYVYVIYVGALIALFWRSHYISLWTDKDHWRFADWLIVSAGLVAFIEVGEVDLNILHNVGALTGIALAFFLASDILVYGPVSRRAKRLWDAACRGDTDTVAQLLDTAGISAKLLGCDVNAKAMDKRLLHGAAAKGQTEMVKLLLERGADIESRGDVSWLLGRGGSTPLHEAAAEGMTETARLLLDRGAQIEALNWRHNTPLHNAARNVQYDTTKLLLERGADVNAVDKSGDTPLDHFQDHRFLLNYYKQVDRKLWRRMRTPRDTEYDWDMLVSLLKQYGGVRLSMGHRLLMQALDRAGHKPSPDHDDLDRDSLTDESESSSEWIVDADDPETEECLDDDVR